MCITSPDHFVREATSYYITRPCVREATTPGDLKGTSDLDQTSKKVGQHPRNPQQWLERPAEGEGSLGDDCRRERRD
ncbi:unnamed protein product [Camellia sinensis]